MTTKSITIVGVGALGSHVAQFLRGEGQLRLIDFDRVEMKNCASQFHGRASVGKLKASALDQTMQFLWGVRSQAFTAKLTEHNVGVLLPNHSANAEWNKNQLVIDCLDNAEARKLVQQHVRKHNIACLHGGLSPAGDQFGRVVWDRSFVIDEDAGAGAATCENGDALPFIVVVAAQIARAAQHWLRHGKQVNYAITPHGITPT